ncbi:hypothetical protein CTheo_7161 [Ceratobasidium theobromae]|uniref:Uncharacterized protein n=1 Tax=Ceratobasidium theobromae TaxID=1582974 RepID=A0A5N5QCK3_9AGAM|nr:hypothetical protein CTheo_7161 [Ceratobasidium theobromae]
MSNGHQRPPSNDGGNIDYSAAFTPHPSRSRSGTQTDYITRVANVTSLVRPGLVRIRTVMPRKSTFPPLTLQRPRPRPASLNLAHSTFSPLKVKGAEFGHGHRRTQTQIIHITHNGPHMCGGEEYCRCGEENEETRASAELAHTQAIFTASLEEDPLPGVRARSPTAYMVAGKSLPMEVEVDVVKVDAASPNKADEFRFPLPTGGYKFPPTDSDPYDAPAPVPSPSPVPSRAPTPVAAAVPRISVGTVEVGIRRGRYCMPAPWLKLVRGLSLRRRRRRAVSAARKLPEPVGFHERIAHAEHEWRPAHDRLQAELEPMPLGLVHHRLGDKGMMMRLPEVEYDTFLEWPWR